MNLKLFPYEMHRACPDQYKSVPFQLSLHMQTDQSTKSNTQIGVYLSIFKYLKNRT